MRFIIPVIMQSSPAVFLLFRDMDMCKVVGFRFLQGPETDQATVQKIRDAIRDQREITVQLINYTKSGSYLILNNFIQSY